MTEEGVNAFKNMQGHEPRHACQVEWRSSRKQRKTADASALIFPVPGEDFCGKTTRTSRQSRH